MGENAEKTLLGAGLVALLLLLLAAGLLFFDRAMSRHGCGHWIIYFDTLPADIIPPGQVVSYHADFHEQNARRYFEAIREDPAFLGLLLDHPPPTDSAGRSYIRIRFTSSYSGLGFLNWMRRDEWLLLRTSESVRLLRVVDRNTLEPVGDPILLTPEGAVDGGEPP